MKADFTMIDQAALALVHKFDRIFNGDDVIFSCFVCMIDNGRQSRGLAAARRTRHKDQAFMKTRKFFEDWWKLQLFSRQNC